MKGWLDKYKDGGPVQENYNDYSVSAPKGYVGDGTFNEGRDYSPAWGGQFQMGGELANVTVKGKRQPIIVSDKNDQRLKAYTDSLRLYNMSKDTFNPKYYGDKDRGANWYNFNGSREDATRFEKAHNIDFDYEYYRSGKFPGKIQPTSVKDWGEGMMAPVYKKPTQPVEYINRIRQTETPELQDLTMGLPVNVSLPELQRQAGPNRITMGRPLFKGGPQTDYYTPIDEAGNVVQSNDFRTSQFQKGGVVKRFMQPTETFKNIGYNPIEKGMSTEYSTSIGGPGEVYLVPGYRQGRLLNDPEATFNMYGEHLGGPFKTVQAAEDFAQLRHKYVEQNKNLPAPFKTRDYAMGGSIPGAVGFTYARTQSPAPSNGKYAKKTMASAQNGMEMRYYQNGLDFEPKGMGKNGKVIKDDRGQWAYPGKITQIGSNQITMQGVPYPVLGISNTGDTQMMYPDQEYEYDGDSVTEYPMMKEGGALQLIKLDQLSNFTNYNTKQPGGWLDKYQ